MLWLDVLIGGLALGLVVLFAISLYQQGRDLVRAVGDTTRRVADASADLNVVAPHSAGGEQRP